MTLFESESLLPARRVRRKRARRAMVASGLSTVLAIAVVFGGVYLVQHPQPIIDQVTVWQYEPTPAVQAHVERLGLTEHGRFLYYASTPSIEASMEFAESCPAHEGEDGFGILGCYVPKSKTIYLYDVTDERLDGTEEITAAHEMLHAAWDRLGDDERTRLSALLEAEYEKHSSDAAFAERMAIYARIEPGEHTNELHSILGTEVAELGAELEEYYARYFTDRQAVTSLHAAANAVFVELKARTDELVAAMDALRAEIEGDYARYTAGTDALNRDVESFNSRAQANSSEEFRQLQAEREELMRRKAELDDLYASIQERSDRFDAMMIELEGLNAVSADLQRGLNIGGKASVEDAG
ncbi:MAG TPA: hypothetical protein VFT01_00850 [Homoserinimonas sp.]|nr:hypothetical protein [Homoserinimonas sp.]